MDQVTHISILLILMVLLLPMLAKRLKRYPKQLKAGKVCILGLYLLANLYLTLLSRSPKTNRTAAWMPFWSYVETMNGDTELGIQIILNILLYIPLGYLLRFTFPKIKAWQVIAIGCAMSALTETTQLVFKLGLFEWDDMIDNTLGTVIGVICYWGVKKMLSRPLK